MAAKVLFLAKRWGHHTESGGYDQILQFMPGLLPDLIVKPPLPFFSLEKFGFKVLNKLWSPKHLDVYAYEDLLAERKSLSLAYTADPDLIHALYGDEQLNLLIKAKTALPCPLIATFHFPVSRMRDRYFKSKRQSLRRLSAAIAVSSVQCDFLSDIIGSDKVFFIPHGINTDIFHQKEKKIEKTLKLFFVGDHMRDFTCAQKVMKICLRDKLDVEFCVRVFKKNWHYFSDLSNVRIVSSIQEPDLIRIYQDSHALFLPLLDATANNSILESISCGTPVISTDLGGVRDYIDEKSSWLSPKGDVDALFESIRSLTGNREQILLKGAEARKHSEKFDWKIICQQINSVYDKVLGL